MALDNDLKKKIADRLANLTPEQKAQSTQNLQQSDIREKVKKRVSAYQFKAPKQKVVEPKKDTTVRLPFSNKRAEMGGNIPVLGGVSRFATDVAARWMETIVGFSLKTASEFTPGGLTVPGLSITVDQSFNGDAQKITDQVPKLSEATLNRQDQLQAKRPQYGFLNTLQAASEEIFLPMLDVVPVFGQTLRAGVKGLRAASISNEARQAFTTIGYTIDSDKAITQKSVKAAVEKAARKNIADLEAGTVTPEQYLQKQSELGSAVDALNNGQTRFGQVSSALSDIANAFTRERTLGRSAVSRGADGVPLVKTADEAIEVTESLLRQQNQALRGELENMRLSNAKVLADTIKESKLTGEVTPESVIKVFTIGNRQFKAGTRVSLDRELARGFASNAPRQVQVIVQDLVRLEDGTFAYAPKALVDTGTDAISTLRKTTREQIITRQKEIQKRVKEQEALEQQKRLADQQEASRLAKEEEASITRNATRKAEAEKVIKDSPVTVAKRKADIDVELAKDLARIRSIKDSAKTEVRTAIAKLRTTTQAVKTAEAKLKTVQKALANAKKKGGATVKINQALTKAKQVLKTAKADARKAQSVVKKAQSKVPTNTKVEVAKVQASASLRKAQVVEESKKAVAEAKEILKEFKEPRVPSTRNAERLQNKITKLEGKREKLIETYGRLEEVPDDELKEIDDAITALKDTADAPPVTPTPTALAKPTPIKPTKSTATEITPTEKIKPVKIEGTKVETSTLMKKLNDGLKNVDSSPEFNVATHAKQAENAFNHIAKNGIDEMLTKAENGTLPSDTTKAAMVSALMESIEATTDPALKLNYTNRLASVIPELSEFATRAGQEIEALKLLHADNPVMKIMRIQRKLGNEKAVKQVANEVSKLQKRLDSIDSKGIINEAIDNITC